MSKEKTGWFTKRYELSLGIRYQASNLEMMFQDIERRMNFDLDDVIQTSLSDGRLYAVKRTNPKRYVHKAEYPEDKTILAEKPEDTRFIEAKCTIFLLSPNEAEVGEYVMSFIGSNEPSGYGFAETHHFGGDIDMNCFINIKRDNVWQRVA